MRGRRLPLVNSAPQPQSPIVHEYHVRRSRSPVLWLVRTRHCLASSAPNAQFNAARVRRGQRESRMAARFQFVRGTAQHSQVQRWPADWAAAVPEGLGWTSSRDLPERASASIAWRLVGANNRELGRSARTYPDVATCREAVAFLRENIGEGDSLLANATDSGLWIWRLNIGERWMAVAGRSYLRRRECQYNLAQFVAEAPTAMFPPDIFGHSEARGRQQKELLLPKEPSAQIVLNPSPSQVSTT
jgi:hypothetical protein